MAYVDQEIPAEFVSAINKKKSSGVVILRKYDEKERLNRTIKYGAACLIGAAVSVFLPLLHFVLVPGFIIAAIAVAVINNRPSNIHRAKAKCPECSVDFVISKGKPVFPIDDVCASCHHKITITKSN